MRVLADTNVILRLMNHDDPLHETVAVAIEELDSRGWGAIQAPQIAAEFWNVCTRPIDKNGLGLSIAVTDEQLRLAEQIFPVLPEKESMYAEWRRLVVVHRVSGKQAHDARLVAFMLTHGITDILTFNGKDFVRYPAINVIDPANLVPPAA